MEVWCHANTVLEPPRLHLGTSGPSGLRQPGQKCDSSRRGDTVVRLRGLFKGRGGGVGSTDFPVIISSEGGGDGAGHLPLGGNC